MGHAPIVIIIIILLLLMAAGFLSALHKDRISFITTLTSCYKPSYVSLPTVQFINATSLPSLRLYRLISQFPRWVQLLFLAPSFLPSFLRSLSSAAACICPQNKFRCAVSNTARRHRPCTFDSATRTKSQSVVVLEFSWIKKKKTKTSLGFPRALLLLIVVDSLRKPWDPCRAVRTGLSSLLSPILRRSQSILHSRKQRKKERKKGIFLF